MSLLAALWADVRFAARTLSRHPGYTIVAIATLAIGISANAVIFSVTRPVLLSPLPFRDSDRLVRVLQDNDKGDQLGLGLSVGDFRDYRRLATSLQDLSAYRTPRSLALSGGDRPEAVRVSAISPSTFPLLGMEPALGRGFRAAEETVGADRVAILSSGFWHRRFGGRATVLRQTLQLDGVEYQVVGVMGERFRYPLDGVDVWVPLALDPANQNRETRNLHSLARLRPGFSVEQADGELKRIAATLAREYPEDDKVWTARAAPFAQHLARRVRPALLLLSAAVGFLLLIACSNLANLLLARGASRSRETAIRAAVGAQARSLVRLFLVESLLLSVVGGLLALPLAIAGVDYLLANSPDTLPRLADIAVNRSVVLFSLALSVVSALIFGLVPALQLARPNLAESSREGEGVGGRRGAAFRSLLVMAEVALALVLLTSASLLFRGFIKLTKVDPGFDARQGLALQINLPSSRYAEDPAVVAFYQRLSGDLSGLPGVRSVAVATTLPLAKAGQSLQPVRVDGDGDQERLSGLLAAYASVSSSYFRTMRIPLQRGREFGTQDVAGAPLVVVISEELSRRAFPEQNPLGRKLILNVQGSAPASYQVVGVVGGVRQLALADDPAPAFYTSMAQVTFSNTFVVLRTEGDPLGVADAAAERVLAVDPAQPVTRTFSLDQLLVEAGAQNRFLAALLSVFAGIGLLLSCVGLYGVIAYNVSRRKHEFAVRMAVGASKQDILWMVISGGLKVTLVGIAIGLIGALALTWLLRSLLFGLGPRDPSSFLVAPLILFLVALLASYLPARRAVRVDPVSPLRQV